MNYNVVLVQRGISASTHPVTGKSGKLYGTATASPEHGGVIFQMSMEDYIADAFDVVGNVEPAQQWVPEFVAATHKAGQHKCDRCSEPAVARWDKYFYCLKHAPANATFLDGRGPVGKAPDGAGAQKPAQPDVAPVVEERVSKPIEEGKELAAEHLPAPAIGTAREEGPGAQTEAGVFVPDQPKPQVVAPPGRTSAPDKAQLVIEAITEGVIAAVMPKLDEIVTVKVAAISKATEHRGKRGKKKGPAKPTQPRAETEFSKLQKRAKALDINSFGKNAETLRKEIADKAAAS